MHRSVSRERLNLAAQSHPEANSVGRIANPDFLFQTGGQIHQADGPVEHLINAFAKTRFVFWLVQFISPVEQCDSLVAPRRCVNRRMTNHKVPVFWARCEKPDRRIANTDARQSSAQKTTVSQFDPKIQKLIKNM
jgi:hypothetical protein